MLTTAQGMCERGYQATTLHLCRTLHTGLLAATALLLLITGQHAASHGTSTATCLTAWLLTAAAATLAAMRRVIKAAAVQAPDAQGSAAAAPPDRYAVLCFPMPDPAWTLASAVPAPPAYALSLRDLRARPVAAATRRPSPLVARVVARAFSSPMSGTTGGARGPAPARASGAEEAPSSKGKLRIDARMFARMSSQQILQGAHVWVDETQT